MAEQKQDDQHEHTFSNYVRIRDVVQKTCQRRWTIGKSDERGSGISVLPARHDDEVNILNDTIEISLILMYYLFKHFVIYFYYFSEVILTTIGQYIINRDLFLETILSLYSSYIQ